jgi:hypothetical protein
MPSKDSLGDFLVADSNGKTSALKFTIWLIFAIFSFLFWCVQAFEADQRRTDRKKARYEERYVEYWREQERRAMAKQKRREEKGRGRSGSVMRGARERRERDCTRGESLGSWSESSY